METPVASFKEGDFVYVISTNSIGEVLAVFEARGVQDVRTDVDGMRDGEDLEHLNSSHFMSGDGELYLTGGPAGSLPVLRRAAAIFRRPAIAVESGGNQTPFRTIGRCAAAQFLGNTSRPIAPPRACRRRPIHMGERPPAGRSNSREPGKLCCPW